MCLSTTVQHVFNYTRVEREKKRKEKATFTLALLFVPKDIYNLAAPCRIIGLSFETESLASSPPTIVRESSRV